MGNQVVFLMIAIDKSICLMYNPFIPSMKVGYCMRDNNAFFRCRPEGLSIS